MHQFSSVNPRMSHIGNLDIFCRCVDTVAFCCTVSLPQKVASRTCSDDLWVVGGTRRWILIVPLPRGICGTCL